MRVILLCLVAGSIAVGGVAAYQMAGNEAAFTQARGQNANAPPPGEAPRGDASLPLSLSDPLALTATSLPPSPVTETSTVPPGEGSRLVPGLEMPPGSTAGGASAATPSAPPADASGAGVASQAGATPASKPAASPDDGEAFPSEGDEAPQDEQESPADPQPPASGDEAETPPAEEEDETPPEEEEEETVAGSGGGQEEPAEEPPADDPLEVGAVTHTVVEAIPPPSSVTAPVIMNPPLPRGLNVNLAGT